MCNEDGGEKEVPMMMDFGRFVGKGLTLVASSERKGACIGVGAAHTPQCKIGIPSEEAGPTG